MISYQTTSPGAALQLVESTTPQPEGSEVLLRTVACGVCHSDVHLHHGAFDLGGGKQLDVAREGLVLGHEICGEVVALGPDAIDYNPGANDNSPAAKIGEHRVVYPWIGCGDCPACARGEEHLCTPGQALGIIKAGGFADHVMVPHSRYLFAKGEVADSLAATYACSGLTAFSALKKATAAIDAAAKSNAESNDNALVIIGTGGVGMMAVQIALAQGINPIAVDIDDAKLAALNTLGVNHTFNSSDPQTAKAIRKLTGGACAAIDFVGAEASVNYGLNCLRKGGTLVIVGLYGGMLTMPIPFISMNARIIHGSYVGSLAEMDELMTLVRSGKLAPIQIHQRPLAEAEAALADLEAGKVIGRQVLMA
ncbi:MAG: alcohol dehydrogenase [Pseudohongiellaceae bacterium]